MGVFGIAVITIGAIASLALFYPKSGNSTGGDGGSSSVAVLQGGGSIPAAPQPSQAGQLLVGDYDLYDGNKILDTWHFRPECRRLVRGCYARIDSATLDTELVAAHTTDNDWSAQIVGMLPICAEGDAEGKLIFEWNGDTMQGTVTRVNLAGCEGEKPDTTVIDFALRPQ